VREDREDGFAPCTLDTPDGEPAQPDTQIMRVTRQAPAPITGCLVLQLETEGQKECEDAFEERLAIVQQVSVGRFIVGIDGDGAVVPRRCGCCGQCVTCRSRILISHEENIGAGIP
jgi:hypothetical protein